ncbi:MAG: AAA family ATPase [Gammaproteobacteria bacterium]|nr:AAA family ATPase [Gammaproteobacteria bacterium]
MSAEGALPDDDVDKGVDVEIAGCLDLKSPKSFFLFAGAGSGKTRSLVKALAYVRQSASRYLETRGQRVAVITFTNAARDEILERLEFDPLVQVSTIHSFIWSLIKGYNKDIKVWLRTDIDTEIAETEAAQKKGRAGTKAAIDRERKLETLRSRRESLNTIRQFIYSPEGDNRGRDALNHAEVLKIGASFLATKPVLRAILTNRFPVLLIDESQDTNRLVMEAFFAVQTACQATFMLGLFGDTMQRIYADGLADLGRNIPDGWATPAKKMNHRCPKRVVSLINKIRADVDGQEQRPRSDAVEGVVRVFIARSGVAGKAQIEAKAVERMNELTGDALWASGNVKTLILEHHMAASRMGFLPMFEILSKSDRLRIGMVDGSLPVLRWFSNVILPLVRAEQSGDKFRSAAIVRSESPLIDKKTLRSLGDNQLARIRQTSEAILHLIGLWRGGKQPTFGEVLDNVKVSGLFDIPDALKPIANRSEVEKALFEKLNGVIDDGDEAKTDESVYDAFLKTPFAQIEAYDAYIKDVAQFATHQGVKGLEFPRVMVIIDDDEARGFLFSYEKLFGVKARTDTDRKNEAEGKETGIDRTKRLFYVTCSRAERELAIVCYSADPAKVRDYLVATGWFTAAEIEVFT